MSAAPVTLRDTRRAGITAGPAWEGCGKAEGTPQSPSPARQGAAQRGEEPGQMRGKQQSRPAAAAGRGELGPGNVSDNP